MAGVSNQSKSKTKVCHVEHDIFFDGALLSSTRAALVSELLHYFLYERQQIPLPVDQLRLRTAVWTSETEEKNGAPHAKSNLSPQSQAQGNSKNCASNRKAKSFLADLQHISDNLKKAFQTCTEVEQVAVLSGGTVFNPRESVLIKFPPPCPDADCLPLDTCRRTLFKQIISEDILGSFPANASPSGINVFLLSPRDLPVSWFLPKHSMKTPGTGTVVSLNFHCTYLVPICHELTIGEEDGNISGLEALDCSQCENECTEHLKFNEGECLSRSGRKMADFRNSIEGELQSDNFMQLKAETPSGKVMSQFCQHLKLNYIYHRHEKHFQKMITSPTGRTLSSSFIKSCALIGSPGDTGVQKVSVGNENHSSNIDQISCQRSDSIVQSKTRGNSEEHEVDCIWYQSPLILKGFKELV